jgi:hypothetical protein
MGPFYNYRSSWYTDDGYFLTSSQLWFIRGGRYALGAYAGQFYFYRCSGSNLNSYTFRITLTPGSTYSLNT